MHKYTLYKMHKYTKQKYKIKGGKNVQKNSRYK